jgi:hypothetical protein
VERVPHPDAEASVILRENLRHIIVRDELVLVELREYSFSEGCLDSFEVYPPAEETESDYRREFRKSSWGACIKRIYEVDPLESVSRCDDA